MEAVEEDPNWRPHDPAFQEEVKTKRDSAVILTGDKKRMAFNEPILTCLRTKRSEIFDHTPDSVENAERTRCILCCQRCDACVDQTEMTAHLRLGFKSSTRCKMCKVALCNVPRKLFDGESCWCIWHSVLKLPMVHPLRKPFDFQNVDEKEAQVDLFESPANSRPKRTRRSASTGGEEEELTTATTSTRGRGGARGSSGPRGSRGGIPRGEATRKSSVVRKLHLASPKPPLRRRRRQNRGF